MEQKSSTKNEHIKIIKNDDNIIHLENYLNKKSNIKAIIIRGPIGCGKLTLINTILNKLKYDYNIINTDYESDDMFDRFLFSITSVSFSEIFYKKKKAIIIKDIDGCLRNSQKNKLYKFINDSPYDILNPLIMTSHDVSIGTVREVPKCILQLNFELPNNEDLAKLTSYISSYNNVNISKNAIYKLISGINYDIRFLKNTIISYKNIDYKININNNFFYKDYKENTFQNIKFCGSPNNTWIKKLYHSSFYTNSTVFHNIPILNKNNNYNTQKLYDLICYAEELRNFAYSYQIWNLFEIPYCIIGTVIPMTLIGNDFSIDNLSYPPSTIGNNPFMFNRILRDAYDIHDKNYDNVYDPIKSMKLINMTKTKKEKDVIFKEIKKSIKSKKI